MLQENAKSAFEGQSLQQNYRRKCRKTLHNSGLSKAMEIKTGHICKVKDERLLKKVMLGMVEGDQPRGRPARR